MSYECEELNDCSSCEDPTCTDSCHDDEEFSVFYGWQPVPDETDWWESA